MCVVLGRCSGGNGMMGPTVAPYNAKVSISSPSRVLCTEVTLLKQKWLLYNHTTKLMAEELNCSPQRNWCDTKSGIQIYLLYFR